MDDVAADAAFLQAIVDQPDDDAPRLIYADWLDDQGLSERAELIRVQIENQHLAPGSAPWRNNSLRARELIGEFGIQWAEPLGAVPGIQFLVYERGFLSTVLFENPDVFFEHATRIVSRAPIREFRFHGFYWQHAMKLAESPTLRHIVSLDFQDGNRIGNIGLEALMHSPHLTTLHELKLQHNNLGSAGVAAIAQRPKSVSLEKLELSHNDLYDPSARELADSPYVQSLRQLCLGWTRLGDAGVRHLAASKNFRHLQMLLLSHNNITDDGAIQLASSLHLKELRSLYLEQNSIADAGITAIADSGTFENLDYLYLRKNHISDAGARSLTESKTLQHLQELVVGENPIFTAKAALIGRFGTRVSLH